ncbi:TAXI family TRAP transporter solute-binding subunit [Halobacillus sp. A5]|uniref:TAXI family TRAP transporter solute-binding subunit n=1 Tax=Halobacillus sp. A5 TaxID=2880263 RepID=UPI0020A63671|nr:TAXI family TRAP transporter solute-binding subunit [Halobacillus sp. A5]MCP3028347.1 TAXI family TRAP transporter solute-binding subunit [Halobacillus sp. A5]
MTIKKAILTLISIGIILIMTGCSGASNANGGSKNVMITTGDTGGTLYPIGASITKIVNDKQKDIKLTNQASGGSVENVNLLQQNDSEFAIIGGDVATDAYEGEDFFKDEPKNVSGVFAAYSQPLAILTRADSPINSIQDIKGKSIRVGEPGSGNEVKTKKVLENLGITYDDINPQFISFSESVDALKNNQIDAAMFWAGSPNASIMDLSTTEDIKLISLSEEERKVISSKMPYFENYSIPAGVYDGVDEEVQTLSVNAQVVASNEASEEVVYSFTKALFENLESFNESHGAVKDLTVENAASNTIPLHPGAEKYFKEKGIIE